MRLLLPIFGSGVIAAHSRRSSLLEVASLAAVASVVADSDQCSVVGGATALDHIKDGEASTTISCRCPVLQALSGDDDACVGWQIFDPNQLDGKGCKCDDIAPIFYSQFEDKVTDDSSQTMESLVKWTQQLKGESATDVAADLWERWIEIRVGVNQNIETLKSQIEEAQEDDKEPLRSRAASLHASYERLLRLMQQQIGRTVQGAEKLGQKNLDDVKKEIEKARNQESLAALQDVAEEIEARNWELHASVLSTTPSRRSLEIATEIIGEKVGDLKQQAREAQKQSKVKEQLRLNKNVKKMMSTLKLLRAGAIDRGAEIGAGNARFLEAVAGRFGEISEELKDAPDNIKKQLEEEKDTLETRLQYFQSGAKQSRQLLRKRAFKAVESVCEDIGLLRIKLTENWFTQKRAVEGQITKFEKVLATIRKLSYGKQVESEGRLSEVLASLKTSIGKLTHRDSQLFDGENKDAFAAGLKELISEGVAPLEQAAKKTHEAYRSYQKKVSDTITSMITEMKAQLQSARTAGQSSLLQEFQLLQRFSFVLNEVDSITDNVKADVKETLGKALKESKMSPDVITKLQAAMDSVDSGPMDAATDAFMVLAEFSGKLLQSFQDGDSSSAMGYEVEGEMIDQLQSWVRELRAEAGSGFAKLEQAIGEAVELSAERAGLLQGELEKATNDKGDLWGRRLANSSTSPRRLASGTEALEKSLTFMREHTGQLRDMAIELKGQEEDQLDESVTKMGTFIGTLRDRLAVLSTVNKHSIKAQHHKWTHSMVDLLSPTLSALQAAAGSMRSSLEVQLIEIAYSTSEQVGEMQGLLEATLTEGSNNHEAEYKVHIGKLESMLSRVRVLGAGKGEDAIDALSAQGNEISELIGRVREQSVTGECGKGSERCHENYLRTHLKTLEMRLEHVKNAGGGMMGMVQQRVFEASCLIQTEIGALENVAGGQSPSTERTIQEEISKLRRKVQKLTPDFYNNHKHVHRETQEVEKRFHDRLKVVEKELFDAGVDEHYDERSAWIQRHRIELRNYKEAVAHRRVAVQKYLKTLVRHVGEYIDRAKKRLVNLNDDAAKQQQIDPQLEDFHKKLSNAVSDFSNAVTAAQSSEEKAEGTFEEAADALVRLEGHFEDLIKELNAKVKTSTGLAADSLAAQAGHLGEWISMLQSAIRDPGLEDVLGAALAVEVIDEALDILDFKKSATTVVVRRLGDDQPQPGPIGPVIHTDTDNLRKADPEILKALRRTKQYLWDIVAERAVDPANPVVLEPDHDDFSDLVDGEKTAPPTIWTLFKAIICIVLGTAGLMIALQKSQNTPEEARSVPV